MLEATSDDVERFMALVDKLPSGCWFWTGARSRGRGNRKWYGTFWMRPTPEHPRGRRVRAHRFSSEVLGGRACPPGHHRDHTCEFSLCVCPDHIDVVHRRENQERKVARRLERGLCP